jgi:hypothetical protein
MAAGGRASKILWLIPVGCLGALVLCAGTIAVVYGVVRTSFRGSEPYQVAISRAQGNAELVAALGGPIEEGSFPRGSISVSGGSGHADLTIPVSGPSGSATVYVQAQKFGGRWEYQRIVANVDGKEIDLLEGGGAPPLDGDDDDDDDDIEL